jgi:hypothetical protein
MRKPHPLRKNIGGIMMRHDRLWRVTGPNFVAGLTEYNDEITGSAPILRKWYTYGDRAQALFNKFRAMGWKVEDIEDRR